MVDLISLALLLSSASPASIFDKLDADLLPLDKDSVLLGCVGPSCSRNGRDETTKHTEEEVLQRKFDLHTSFIQPSVSIFDDVGGDREDSERLQHFSWQLCRSPFDPPNCSWRAIANGELDDALIVPAARHIAANVTRPIVLALCNEMMGKDFVGACGAFPRFSPECPLAYKAMYAHVRRVFAREGVVTGRHVVWSWNTFNVPAVDKHGRPGNKSWDEWYVGDSNGTFANDTLWVGVNAFNNPAADPNGTSFMSAERLYATFYRWVTAGGPGRDPRRVRPFFHAFGTAERPGHEGWKKAWFEQLPALLGPSGPYPRVRAATIFPGDVYDIQTSGESIAGAKVAANAHVFDAAGYANATAAACCKGDGSGGGSGGGSGSGGAAVQVQAAVGAGGSGAGRGGASGAGAGSAPLRCCWEYRHTPFNATSGAPPATQ